MYMDLFFWGGRFDTLFFLIFTIIIVMFVVGTVRRIGQWNRNNYSPRLSVTVRVTAKRTSVVRRRHANARDMTGAHGFHSSSSTSYYVTSEVTSGDRMELSVSGSEHGMLAEGDIGTLGFQGTRHLGFERYNSRGTKGRIRRINR